MTRLLNIIDRTDALIVVGMAFAGSFGLAGLALFMATL